MRGLSYPLKVVNGSIQLSSEDVYIRDQVQSYVETLPGERVFWRDYGCSLEVFEAFSGDISKIINALNYDLSQWIDASLSSNYNYTESGSLDIEIGIIKNG